MILHVRTCCPYRMSGTLAGDKKKLENCYYIDYNIIQKKGVPIIEVSRTPP